MDEKFEVDCGYRSGYTRRYREDINTLSFSTQSNFNEFHASNMFPVRNIFLSKKNSFYIIDVYACMLCIKEFAMLQTLLWIRPFSVFPSFASPNNQKPENRNARKASRPERCLQRCKQRKLKQRRLTNIIWLKKISLFFLHNFHLLGIGL